jgi:hypothetical protein
MRWRRNKCGRTSRKGKKKKKKKVTSALQY